MEYVFSPTSSGGSRAGGLIADCWAALIYYGREGYVQKVKDIVSTTRYIEKELRRVKGVKIMGDPQVCIIALGKKCRQCLPQATALIVQVLTSSTSTPCPTR